MLSSSLMFLKSIRRHNCSLILTDKIVSRIMELKRRTRVVGEVYTSSLNDIMFFLLLFFLSTSTLATPNVLKLLLPNAKSKSQSVKHPLTISVDANSQYAINNTPIAPEQLEESLKTLIKDQTDPTALLKVDKSVQVQ